ncbi:hypothetical protein V5O48_009656 [Marasmius crinis-equi]|uniref:Uncharacterized protein n=1 Tax=Marasmius crinis-equi TaxID=585013 RepID=A0ABR3FAL2_9AGAR
MDITLSYALVERHPAFPLLLQAIITEQQSDELLRPVVTANPVPSQQSVILRHDPSSRRVDDPLMATLVLDAAEYWVVQARLQSIVAEFRQKTTPHAVQVIIIGLNSDPQFESRSDEVERHLLRISERQHIQYFFLDDLEAFARSTYGLGLALNPFRVWFREARGNIVAEDVMDAIGRYHHRLLQVGGFTVPNVRAVSRVFPSPSLLMKALRDPLNAQKKTDDEELNMNVFKDLGDYEWTQLNLWASYLLFALTSGSSH